VLQGAPASIKIYGLVSLNSPPTSQKTFFKADRAQIKWNTLGTQVLLLTQTEVDNSNKSYYGETGMYLLTAAGHFDCRVTLDKEGPIHDFAWSPNSKEFGVVYGCEPPFLTNCDALGTEDYLDMPAKTVIFDHRVRTLHDFGSSPHNFISFNPQGRLVALAGFGNLAGKLDVFDRRTLNKVCTIDAPNTSHCEWSPDGRFLLTATLSPRLRVDNGIKIWHCSGTLVHVQNIDELYQVSWRPTPIDAVPPFGPTIPVAPEPGTSVQDLAKVAKPAPTKPAGAYRPPGARGLATPSIFKREDEGGAARMPTNGTSTPPRGAYNRSPAPGVNGYGAGQQNGGGKRHVPGAAPQHSGSATPEDREKKNKKKNKKKENAKDRATQDVITNEEVVSPKPEATEITVDQAEILGGDDGSVPPTPGGELSLDPLAKKIRNLNKKVSLTKSDH